MTLARVGILISGGGSNMHALVKASHAADYPAVFVCVISNTPNAGGLEIAQSEGIATHVVNHKDYATREDFDAALNLCLQSQQLDLIACAGFMKIMTPVLIAPWEGRMINIHPSLLPLYKGLHTHARALADGQSEAGCTVHYVTAELDDGPIIAQSRVPIHAGDTADTLAARVLIAEHQLYPQTLATLAQQIS